MIATELRIGNRVYSPIHEKEGFVAAIEIGGRPVIDMGDGLTASFSGADCLNGIALTPEVLLSCGFVDPAGNSLAYRKDWGLMEFVFYSIEGFVRYQTKGNGFSINNKHITHLHQLQNLYWCLTGTELNYEPQRHSI